MAPSPPYRVPWLSLVTGCLGLFAITWHFAPNYRWCEERRDHPYGADFLQEWVGARMIGFGDARELYRPEAFRAMQHDNALLGFSWNPDRYFPPVYPPVHYALGIPFGAMPYRWAALLWMAILWTATAVAACLLVRIAGNGVTHSSPLPSTPPTAPKRFAALHRHPILASWLLLLAFPPTIHSIMLGQKSVLWLLLACWVVRWVQSGKEGKAGAWLALFSLKPTLVFFVPWFLARHRRWKMLSGMFVGGLALGGLALAFLPVNLWWDFARTLGSAGSYASHPGYRVDWSCNLTTLVRAWAGSDPNFAPGGASLGLAIVLTLACLTIALAPTYRGAPWDGLLAMLAGTFLMSPHAYAYDLPILLLPLAGLYPSQPRRAIAYYAILSLAFVMSGIAWHRGGLPLIPLVLLSIAAHTACCSVVPNLRLGLRSRMPRLY